MEMYNRILEGFKDTLLPSAVKSAAKHFIKSLLREDPIKRIGFLRNGVADIRNHRYNFIGIVGARVCFLRLILILLNSFQVVSELQLARITESNDALSYCNHGN